MPDDVRITGPAPGSVPTAETVVAPPAVAAAAPAAAPEAVVVAAPPAVLRDAAPIAAPVVEAPVVEAAVEVMPTAQPTLFEKFEKKQADAAADAEAAKPAADATDKPAAEAAPEATPATDKAADDKPPAVAEGEKPAADPAKPAVVEAAPVVPQPAAVKWEYQLPENVMLPEKETGELHGALQHFATNPGDKAGQQALVDFHFARLRDSMVDYNRQAHKAFADKRAEWQKAVESHPEIGGGNHDAAMQSIAYVRDNFVSSHPRGSRQYEAAKVGLDEWMHLTGAGDNPFFLEMMHNIGHALNEPQIQATQEIKPIVQQDNGGRPAIYKHPTSFPRR